MWRGEGRGRERQRVTVSVCVLCGVCVCARVRACVLCCAVLCCAVLCCVALCCVRSDDRRVKIKEKKQFGVVQEEARETTVAEYDREAGIRV